MTMATVLLVVGVGMSLGSNPLVPGVGMADPNLHRFNGSYYVFATHDFSVNNTGSLANCVLPIVVLGFTTSEHRVSDEGLVVLELA